MEQASHDGNVLQEMEELVLIGEIAVKNESGCNRKDGQHYAQRFRTTQDAATADIVILAVRWANLHTALGGLPHWNGRIVIDGTNPVEFLASDSPDRKDPNNPLAAYGLKTIDLGGRVSTRVVGRFVPGARVVKAFNHLPVNLLPEPAAAGGKRVLFYSGDDAGAKAEVRKVLERTGHVSDRSWDAGRGRAARFDAVRPTGGKQPDQGVTSQTGRSVHQNEGNMSSIAAAGASKRGGLTVNRHGCRRSIVQNCLCPLSARFRWPLRLQPGASQAANPVSLNDDDLTVGFSFSIIAAETAS
ncbi:MAG TPA: NAD(P)-binding domain-containing protein [Rhizomicrobium sp.]|nr:NAD(P)-binding domain-containing protein [Rhizomicrobium sp.]